MDNSLDSHATAYSGDRLYDFDNEIILNWYPRRIITLTTQAISILELGLGHGFTTNNFSKHFDRHVVLEGSTTVIDRFHGAFPDCGAEIIETLFEQFETDERFDVIVMGFILEHVDDPLEILARFKKFLNSGGKMYVAVPNAESLNRRLGNLMGHLPDMQTLSEYDHVLGHKRYYTVATLTHDVSTAGFDVVKLEGIYLKPFTTRQMKSLNLDQDVLQGLCKTGIEYPELCCGILAQIENKP